jgi:alkanesulfonate monooxygenase SsuD/methylene tetrahydromethanopterin reductase-like flavin-dependent oxidoreductase (luciferase family)
VGGRVPRVELGTAVLLPALRNPVVLAQQVATLDQISEGRVILGVGIAADLPNIRAEFTAAGVPFEKRVGRLLEGVRLCRELWTGAPVSWNGRWRVEGVLGVTPHRPGGPPLWIAGALPASLERAGRHFDGWLPNGQDAKTWAEQWAQIKAMARAAGRDPDKLTGAMYLTAAVEENAARADERLNAYMEQYYGQPAHVMRARQMSFAGPAAGFEAWLQGYVAAGVNHIVLRFAGDHERHLKTLAQMRAKIAG